MILLRLALTGVIVWSVILGLWEHDWRLILAGVATAVVWPLVQGEVTPHEAQPHHDPDHGSPDSSAARVGLPTDPLVLDEVEQWVFDQWYATASDASKIKYWNERAAENHRKRAESALRSDPRREA